MNKFESVGAPGSVAAQKKLDEMKSRLTEDQQEFKSVGAAAADFDEEKTRVSSEGDASFEDIRYKVSAKRESIASLEDQAEEKVARAVEDGYITEEENDAFIKFARSNDELFEGEENKELLDKLEKWSDELNKKTKEIFELIKKREEDRKLEKEGAKENAGLSPEIPTKEDAIKFFEVLKTSIISEIKKGKYSGKKWENTKDEKGKRKRGLVSELEMNEGNKKILEKLPNNDKKEVEEARKVMLEEIKRLWEEEKEKKARAKKDSVKKDEDIIKKEKNPTELDADIGEASSKNNGNKKDKNASVGADKKLKSSIELAAERAEAILKRKNKSIDGAKNAKVESGSSKMASINEDFNGRILILEKIAVKDGEVSNVGVGGKMEGDLVGEIMVGKNIILSTGENHNNTSKVESIKKDGDGYIIETKASRYKLSVGKKEDYVKEKERIVREEEEKNLKKKIENVKSKLAELKKELKDLEKDRNAAKSGYEDRKKKNNEAAKGFLFTLGIKKLEGKVREEEEGLATVVSVKEAICQDKLTEIAETEEELRKLENELKVKSKEGAPAESVKAEAIITDTEKAALEKTRKEMMDGYAEMKAAEKKWQQAQRKNDGVLRGLKHMVVGTDTRHNDFNEPWNLSKDFQDKEYAYKEKMKEYEKMKKGLAGKTEAEKPKSEFEIKIAEVLADLDGKRKAASAGVEKSVGIEQSSYEDQRDSLIGSIKFFNEFKAAVVDKKDPDAARNIFRKIIANGGNWDEIKNEKFFEAATMHKWRNNRKFEIIFRALQSIMGYKEGAKVGKAIGDIIKSGEAAGKARSRINPLPHEALNQWVNRVVDLAMKDVGGEDDKKQKKEDGGNNKNNKPDSPKPKKPPKPNKLSTTVKKSALTANKMSVGS